MVLKGFPRNHRDYPSHRVVKCEITRHTYVTYMVRPVSMATLLSARQAVPHGQRQLWPCKTALMFFLSIRKLGVNSGLKMRWEAFPQNKQ